MKSKKGYKEMKPTSNVGKWLKRYYKKRACRRDKHKLEYQGVK